MKLTIKKCEALDDWYLIERAEHEHREWEEEYTPGGFWTLHSARFSHNADVEGSSIEMREIAKAIERRGEVSFKRCEVRVEGDKVAFCSPRNSCEDGVVSLAEADDLARQIREMLP